VILKFLRVKFINHPFIFRFFIFVWANVVSSDTECCCFKPVHSVIIEGSQNQVSHLEGGTEDRKLVYVIGRLFLCSAAVVRRGHKSLFVHFERNSPTPVRRRFSLILEGLYKGHSRWWTARR